MAATLCSVHSILSYWKPPEPLPLFHNILCPVTIRAVPNGVKTTDQLGHALSAATCRKKRKRRTASSLLLCFVPGNESSGTQRCNDDTPTGARIVCGHCPLTCRRAPCSGRGDRPRTGSSSAARDHRCRWSHRRSCR